MPFTKAGSAGTEAEDFLMIPEYLLWKLWYERRGYTNATSTGLVNARSDRI